jgi:hypothetical protein
MPSVQHLILVFELRASGRWHVYAGLGVKSLGNSSHHESDIGMFYPKKQVGMGAKLSNACFCRQMSDDSQDHGGSTDLQRH